MATPQEINDSMSEINRHKSIMAEFAAESDAIARDLDTAKRLEAEAEEDLRKLTGERGRRAGDSSRSLPVKGGRSLSLNCASAVGAIAILGAHKFGQLSHLSENTRAATFRHCQGILDSATARAALNGTDIPLSVEFSREIVSLTAQYGKARRYGTVFPAGLGKPNLPRLKSSPGFGFIDLSAAIPEKSPQFEFVEFDPQKAGGIVRVPHEIDEDSIIDIGLFIADYAAREMGRWEDEVFFNADGTSPWKSMKGCLRAAFDAGRKVTLGAGLTSTADIALADLRAMRAQVETAALFSGAYYFHPTMEGLLVKCNSLANGTVYTAGPGGPALDNFPVRFVEVLPVHDGASHPGRLQGVFGDLSYAYFSERGPLTVQTSKSVYFATDEIAARIIERFAVNLMAEGAVSVIVLGT